MKIRYKITILFTLLVIAILLIFNIAVYYFTSIETRENFRRRLKGRAGNNAQIFDYFGDSSINMLRRIDAQGLATLPQKTVIIYSKTDRPLYEYNAEDAPAFSPGRAFLEEARAKGQFFFRDRKRDGFALNYVDDKNEFVIAVLAYDRDGMQRLDDLKKILGLCLLAGILVAVVTGFIFSAQLVKPIKGIIKDVNEISSHNLSKRLHSDESLDELNQLALTFNNLLNRLQDSFDTQRRFISNASHEMSTPLTSISSQLQVTLQKQRSPQEYEQVMRSIQEDVEQMRQLTKSLLEMAKAGTQGSIELKDVRMDELLLKIIGDLQKLNPDHEVELEFPDTPDDERQCLVFGNADLLYSALRNVVENACKYSTDHKACVKVTFPNTHIEIDVENNGATLKEKDIEQIFQPFFRGLNAEGNRGFGLGLPLARRIIRLHKGAIRVSSAEGHTHFLIRIPSVLSA